MRTRSTARAEAARLQISTRSQARAAMAPPASKPAPLKVTAKSPAVTAACGSYRRPLQKPLPPKGVVASGDAALPMGLAYPHQKGDSRSKLAPGRANSNRSFTRTQKGQGLTELHLRENLEEASRFIRKDVGELGHS